MNECLKIIFEILNTNKNIPIYTWVVSFLSVIFISKKIFNRLNRRN